MTQEPKITLDWSVLDIDAHREVERISGELREAAVAVLHKRGAVVAISGGVDSAVCAALAVRAFGPGRVLALILPERESSPESEIRARVLAAHLGITPLQQDVGATLTAIGCYRSRDEAVRRVLPDYGAGWGMKIAVAGGLEGRINHFNLVAQSRTEPLTRRASGCGIIFRSWPPPASSSGFARRSNTSMPTGSTTR